jgi:hypothetical protein
MLKPSICAAFHYQDYRNREIDAVISLNDGRWCAFEIKLGANQIDERQKACLGYKRKFPGGKFKSAVSFMCNCGLSKAAYRVRTEFMWCRSRHSKIKRRTDCMVQYPGKKICRFNPHIITINGGKP